MWPRQRENDAVADENQPISIKQFEVPLLGGWFMWRLFQKKMLFVMTKIKKYTNWVELI
jgi:hypothetical protein